MPARCTAGAPSGTRPHLTAALLVAVASSLAGCGSPTGDFGRPVADPLVTLKQTVLARRDSIRQVLELDDPATTNTIDTVAQPVVQARAMQGAFLTLPEAELRRRIWHFRQPLRSWRETSAIARDNAIADRLAEDHDLLRAALDLRPDIAERDRMRRAAVAADPTTTAAERANVAAVALENTALFGELCRRSQQRAAWYRSQLARQFIAAPEAAAVTAERRLIAFEATLSEVCHSDARKTTVPQSPDVHQPDATAPAPPVDLAPALIRKF